MQEWDAIVVGGGCAGLACATRLSETGKKVLVLEKKPYLGGRASSYVDRVSLETIDNGQHLFLGCYTETQAYLKRIGRDQDLVFADAFEAPLYGPDGSMGTLKTARLPAPFHLLAGVMGFRALSFSERVKLGMVALSALRKKNHLGSLTVEDWLKRAGQSSNAITRFWDPLVLATLNVDKRKAPAELLATVLVEGFMRSRQASRVGLARVGLSELFGSSVETYLQHRQSRVLTRQRVGKINFSNGQAMGVTLEGGQVEKSRFVVSSVPPDVLRKLTQHEGGMSRYLAPTEGLFSSPILSLHLWLDQELIDAPFAGFWGTQFHWIFVRKKILAGNRVGHVTLVASAAHGLMGLSKAELTDVAQKELEGVFKKRVLVRRSILIKEPQATWIPPLGNSAGRLDPSEDHGGLYVCGDWTDTGLPATIESAVASGHRSAAAIMTSLRRP